MKILACSDIHLGRIPSLPGRASDSSITGSSAWEAVVTAARAENVDVLVIAGDIVNQDDAWFEAYGPLLKYLRDLESDGIQVVAVAGNHDSKVFPNLLKENPETNLLGVHGIWEAKDIKEVRFIGWSFPSNHYSKNPFDDFDNALFDFDGPILGLLHCDVGGQLGKSRYAPVPSFKLDKDNKAFWILGHIHGSSLSSNQLYCGSPFALDSRERGSHGVWILENEGSLWKTPEFVQICDYRFEVCEVTLDVDTTDENVTSYIHEALSSFTHTLAQEGFFGKLYCKLVFKGIVSPDFNLRESLTFDQLESWELPAIEKIEISPLGEYDDMTEIDLDLNELAKGTGPKALLARMLLDKEQLDVFINEAQSLINESFDSSSFSLVREFDGLEYTSDAEKLVRIATAQLLRSMSNQGARNE